MKTFVVLTSCLSLASAGLATLGGLGLGQFGGVNNNNGFPVDNSNSGSFRGFSNSVPVASASSNVNVFDAKNRGGNGGFGDFGNIDLIDRAIRHGGGADLTRNLFENGVRHGGGADQSRNRFEGVRHGSGADLTRNGFENGVRHSGGADLSRNGYDNAVRQGGGASAGGYENGGKQSGGTGANGSGSNNAGGNSQGSGGDSSSGADQQQGGQVRRFVSVHVAPEDNVQPETRVIRAGPMTPDTHFNIIFVKAPSMPVQKTEVLLPPAPMQNTLVYVLVKKPDENQDNVKLIAAPTKRPAKPEVYFIRYKSDSEGEEASGSALPESGPSPNDTGDGASSNSNGFGSGPGASVPGSSPSASYGAPSQQNGGDPARYQ